MNSKILYYFLIGGLALVAIMGMIAFSYIAFGELGEFIPEPIKEVLPQRIEVSTVSPVPAVQGPKAGLSVDVKGRLIFSWKNLPDGVKNIQILRARPGQPRWSLWKTISINDLKEGLIQLQTSYSASLLAYTFYFQGLDENGKTVWTSGETSITETQNSEPATQSTPIPTPQTPSSGNLPPPETPNPVTAPTTNTSSGGGSSTSPTTATNTIIYYTPQGEIAGSVPVSQDPFWAKQINKKIEIGWSNLDPTSEEVVISRALSGSGPWTVLFRQSQPITNTPYSIFILDDSVHQLHYYKLEARNETGQIVTQYGPVVFEPTGS